MTVNARRSTKLEPGSMAPAIELQTLEGRRFSLWDLKGKKNAVILFFDVESDRDVELLDLIADREAAFGDNNAEVIAIADATSDEIAACLMGVDVPFEVLADLDGHITAAYGVTDTTVFVTDRFGEIDMITKPADGPCYTLDRVLDKLALTELECPECGVSTWPAA